MTPEEFDKLPPAEQSEVIRRHDETVRMWSATCLKCGFKTIGTLAEIRGKPCGNCGYTGNGNG